MFENSFWDTLASQGWAVQDHAVPEAFWQDLARLVEDRAREDRLKPARIGREQGLQKNIEIRGDSISWLEAQDNDPRAQAAWSWLEQLRRQLNQEMRLGLRHFEAHVAQYPAGRGYDLHLDQHQGTGHRRITFILYLNSNWGLDDGGELELHAPRIMTLAPEGGRLVLFRSELFPHRVRPARRDRKSLTGWFRDDDPL